MKKQAAVNVVDNLMASLCADENSLILADKVYTSTFFTCCTIVL